MIRFNKFLGAATLHSPLKNFELDSQPIEYREDPLTGLTSFIRTGRAFWASIYKTDEELIARMASESRGRCFFCPERVTQSTPTFTRELFPEGRLTRGEAVLFPNLFAQKEWSAIAVVTRRHYLRLDEFSPQLLADAFKLGARYLRQAHEKAGAKYGEMGSNYLFPGGASIMHPHLQVLASNGAHYLIKLYLERGKEHYQQYSRNYWEELVEEEKRLGERYLGRIGNTEWFTPFAAPREDEIHGVVRGKSNFLEFEDSDWEDLAQGLSRILAGYQEKGLSCFNFAAYSGPLGQKLDYLWAGLKIISRNSVQAYPVCDLWYSPTVLFDGFVTDPPEEIARSMRKYFS